MRTTKLTITKKSTTKQAAKNRADAAWFAARDIEIARREEAARVENDAWFAGGAWAMWNANHREG